MKHAEALLFEEAARVLLAAEERVRLVSRAAPRHAEDEAFRLERAFSLGQKL
jgi:hypothetical protein